MVERTVEIVVKAIKKAYDYMNGNDIIEEDTISENIINSFEIYFNSLHNENMKVESIDKSTIYNGYYKIQFKELDFTTSLHSSFFSLHYNKNLLVQGTRSYFYYTIPCAIIASATFRKPATFAPTIRSPGLPHSTDAS